jgi:hypothetical protein
MQDLSGRHLSTQHFAVHFNYEHLPAQLQPVSKVFHDAVDQLLDLCNDGPELTAALRKLWEAKNSAVLHSGFLNQGKS